jgi:hypothetical protein
LYQTVTNIPQSLSERAKASQFLDAVEGLDMQCFNT